MPTKRLDETQNAFLIRCIRDDEAEACIEITDKLTEEYWQRANVGGAGVGWAEAATRRAAVAIRNRIRKRAETQIRP